MKLEEKIIGFNKEIQPEGWQMEVSFNADTPVLTNGLKYLSDNSDLLLAMCLNNGYYNRENIYRMLKFALSFSNCVQIFITDGPAKHNYLALGKEKDKIPAVTRLARNRLRNQCNEGLRRINVELPESERRAVTFMEWEDIYKDQTYQDSYKALKDLYAANSEFKKDIDDSSEKVLLNRIGIEKEVEAVLSIGIEYVVEELAFILAYSKLEAATKPVSDHGNQGFSYFYYENWPVFEKLANGIYDQKPKDGIGFVIAKIQEI